MNPVNVEQYISTLEWEVEKNADPATAAAQSAYMKNLFPYYGLKTPLRREITAPFLAKEHLPSKEDAEKIVKALWEKPQREYHYVAQELIFKYQKQFEEKDLELFVFMVANKSWWDTVDFIAARPIGEYFKKFPHQRDANIKKWLASGNLWLQRSAILFQLHYKDKLDTDFLAYVINSLLGSKEFFINKAIGWTLRQYSRTNPEWVVEFVNKTDNLAGLSKREALRLIQG